MSFDWYFRTNPSDTGYTTAARAYVESSSPDIIPVGTSAIPKDKYKAQLVDTYNQDVGKEIELGAINYIHLRGKPASALSSVAFELYYSPSNVILDPFFWLDNQLSTAEGKTQVTISSTTANQVVATDPFQWRNPVPPTPPADHYCLISRSITPNHPNTIPTTPFTSVDSLAQWVHSNPGIGWRNVAIDYSGAPTYTRVSRLTLSPKYTNPVPALILLTVDNWTPGWDVAAQIQNADSAGNTISFARATIRQASYSISQLGTFNPGYDSPLSIQFWTNGIAPTGSPSVRFQFGVMSASSSPLFQYGAPLKKEALGAMTEDYVKGYLRLPASANLKDFNLVLTGDDGFTMNVPQKFSKHAKTQHS